MPFHHDENKSYWATTNVPFDPYENPRVFDDTFNHTQEFTEHDFMKVIRSRILEYRLQSPRHFAESIEVCQAGPLRHGETDSKLTPSFRIKVVFEKVVKPHKYRLCRPVFRKRTRKSKSTPTDEVQIRENSRWISIEDFLSVYYPALNLAVKPYTMQDWWNANGKTFNWTALPTELKEHVMLFCLHRPEGHGLYQRIREEHKRHSYQRTPAAARQKLGVYEVVDKLGDWCHLLGVARQVRALALRLCFLGSSGVASSKGLCIDATSYRRFEECIHRLGWYYQMTAANSLPVNQKTEALAKCYSQFPKIYPHLSQYATFRHGIRKICLKMSLLSYMRFFKVTVGGFEKYWWTDNHMTSEVFDQLPLLNEVVIKLPVRPRGVRGWRDNYMEGGPALIHYDFPCPRILHRIIYERIAEVLASCERVQLFRFLDYGEAQRFLNLRQSAIKKLKFTSAKLEHLYADDGGGVELDPTASVLNKVVLKEFQQPTLVHVADDEKPFFPPKCRCTRNCTTFTEW